jgi:hypothetical protein
MRRLTPVELRQLEMLVTNPQRMLAAKFKQTMREAVLGREEPER